MKSNLSHRESLDADGEGDDEDVPPGAEPGHWEADEDEHEEPDDHPQGVRAAGPGSHDSECCKGCLGVTLHICSCGQLFLAWAA